VRDINEDQEYLHPAQIVANTAADQVSRGLADPALDPSADTTEPARLLSSCGHPTLSAALQHEPVVEAFSPDTQPAAAAGVLQAQYSFPCLMLDAPTEPGLGPGAMQAVRPRQPRSSSTKRALKAAQIKLWPDEEGLTGQNGAR
jgi:hypothetical protein